jgi:DNA polymerase-3 subunit epsilon
MQRSFEDLGTPLHDVTFCVIDLETTGASPNDCGITEVGAVKLRGGECLGTFQTLVNPGVPVPPVITVLTGITTSMLMPAPRVAEVLPAFLEFAHGTVLVGHNLRFDLSFLNAALVQHGRPRLAHRWVDTAALARRLVRDEVPNCKLGTLASRLRLDHTPTHRALDDALATGDLLHLLLERAGRLGVTGLDDLLTLPKLAGHPQVAKLRLTERLPRTPGVYLFRDAGDRVLYVGKATNLRTRVRSYFSGDDRRKIGPLLREARHIDHIPCASALEAGVLEVRLIHDLLPRYNRQVKRWRSYVYVKLTNERFPRLSVVRTPKAGSGLHLGPLPSSRTAKHVIEAIETAVPIRRCTATPGKILREAPCAAAQLGVATCPCSGAIDEGGYAAIIATVVRGLTREPDLLLAPLEAKMRALALDERYEEAADVRDRADALARALRRQRRFDALRASGRLIIEVPGQHGAELTGGRLVRAWTGDAAQGALPFETDDGAGTDGPVPRDLADELACVAGWLEANAGRVRVVHCDEGLRSLLPALPSFAAVQAR